jgi:hypothetical protein
MCNRTKLGLNILEAALLLGVLGDALLRETPWGVNVPLWTGTLVAAMFALHGRYGGCASWRADGGWLLLAVAFFASAFAWRDSGTLKFLDGLALFVSLALLAWRARGRAIRLAGLGDYALGLGHAAFNALFASLPLVVTDMQWGTIPRNGMMRHVWAVARGVVIAVPLLFLFGALFMAADAVFEGIMRQTFQLDAGVLFSHFFLALLFAWMTGGFLRGMLLAEKTGADAMAHAVVPPVATVAYTSITVDDKKQTETGKATRHESETAGAHRLPPESVVIEGGATAESKDDSHSNSVQGSSVGASSNGVDEAREQTGDTPTTAKTMTATTEATVTAQVEARGFSLGAIEVGVVLGLLNVLFACFVAVQFRYFFGGAARVMSITELTYSEYARRGFFELTWVAGLVLPLLLIAHALLRKEQPLASRIFRTLAGTQVALLFIIMASAVGRMRLYQSEYGLTELRLYTTAFMLWLGLVFVWFAWTVLVRSQRERFACGALVAAFVTIGLLHLLNPDAFIVRANAAHARAGRAFDAEYAATLSADAVPALISALPSLGRDERCLLAHRFSQDWTHATFDEDWRAWNFARWRARRAVSAQREALSHTGCPEAAGSLPVITTATTTSAPETIPTSPTATTTFTPADRAIPNAPATDPTTTKAATATATNNVSTMSMKTEPNPRRPARQRARR